MRWDIDFNGDGLESFDDIKVDNCKYARLSNNNIKSLHGLENFHDLIYLDVHCCKLVTLDGIEKCPQLETLIAWDNPITDFSALNKSKVKFLDVSSCNLTSLQQLEGDLEIINIAHNKLTDLKGIEKFPHLRIIHCWENNITDIGEIPEQVELINCHGNPLSRVHDNRINWFET